MCPSSVLFPYEGTSEWRKSQKRVKYIREPEYASWRASNNGRRRRLSISLSPFRYKTQGKPTALNISLPSIALANLFLTYLHAHESSNDKEYTPDDTDAVHHGRALSIKDASLQLQRVRVQKVHVDEEREAELAKEGHCCNQTPDLKGIEERSSR